MKRNLISLLVVILTIPFIFSCKQENKKPRIAIAGIKIESGTFSPALSTESSFNVRIGDEIINNTSYLQPGSALHDKAVWIPTLVARATPGGAVTKETYEKFVNIILDSLKANLPIDALYYDIHGAMSVVGVEDPEGDMLVRIREVIGKDALVTSSMDLHGNVSLRLAENTDFINCYRMAPHEDAYESKERAMATLIDRIESGKGRPKYKAWIPIPILLPGEQTSTRVEPAKSLYAKLDPASKQEGIIDASIWIGYAWADEPRNHAVVMVTGDDKEKVVATAESLAKDFWGVRHQFDFVAPMASLEECLNKAIASKKKPFFISDTGDNPTAGGAGDVTWTLTEILKRKEFQSPKGPSVIYASIPDADFVKKAIEIGAGGMIDATAGAQVDSRYAPPVRLKGLITGVYPHDTNSEVVIRIGSVNVIVTEKRKGFHTENEFTKLNLEPTEADIVIVKIGYLEPELYNMQADWMMAFTHGGVNQKLDELPYQKINRPMYPLDKDMADPDLTARLIPFVSEK